MNIVPGRGVWGYYKIYDIEQGHRFYCQKNSVVLMSEALEKRPATMAELKGKTIPSGFFRGVVDDLRGGSASRKLLGEDLSFVLVEAKEDRQDFLFTSHFPGIPLHLELHQGYEVYAGKGSFLLADVGVLMELFPIKDVEVRQEIGDSLQHFYGKGHLFLEVCGGYHTVHLRKGIPRKIMPSQFLAVTGNVTFKVEKAGGAELRSLEHPRNLVVTANEDNAVLYINLADKKEFYDHFRN